MGFYPNNKDVAATPVITEKIPELVSEESPYEKLTPDDAVSQQKYVVNTVNNQTAVNTERREEVVRDLLGFAEGTATKVTYYKMHYAETDVRGRPDCPDEDGLHPAHRGVLKINGFELKLTGPLQGDHDVENTTSSLKGEAYTYPGFQPEKGDQFIMEVDIGKWGCMQITQHPQRMSIRASTYYKISFDLIEWMSVDHLEKIESAIIEEAWFDKNRFLNEPGALLYHDEYVLMKYFISSRSKMIKYFAVKFLDKDIMYSYMRPDSVYDPYVVDFILASWDQTETNYYAMQLHEGAPYLNCSVWRALLDKDLPLEAVPTASKILTYVLGSKSVLQNSLINKKYLEFINSMSLADFLDQFRNKDGEDSGNSSGEGEIPGTGNLVDLSGEDEDHTVGDLLLHLHPHYNECPLMDGDDVAAAVGGGGAFDYIFGADPNSDHFKLLMKFLTTREIDTKLLQKCIQAVWKLPLIEQFYKMPIYAYLCKLAVEYIQHYNILYQ